MSLLPFLDGLQRLPNATGLVFVPVMAAMAVFLAVFGCTTLNPCATACWARGEAPPRSKDLHYAHRAEQPPSSCCCAREPVGREQPPRPIISVHVQRSTANRRPSLQDRCKPRRPPERPWGPSAERRRSRTRACGACWRCLAPVTVANGSCRAGMSP